MRISIIIFIGVLTCCNQGVTEKETTEELNVLNQTFIDLVGTEWYYEPLPPPPLPLWEESTHEDSLRFKIDSIEYEAKLNNRKLDTSELKVFLHDSLTTYKSYDRLDDILTLGNFEANFPVDTSWIRLIRKLNQIDNPKRLDLSKISQTGNYTLVSDSEFKDTTDNKRKIGMMTLSRVAFSENYERAVFYYTFICGSLCGWGSIVFVERKGEKWKIIGKRGMWVS